MVDINDIRRQELLKRHPLLLWEALAHYTLSSLKMANDLRRMTDLINQTGGSKQVEEAAEYVAKQMRQHHLETFGVDIVSGNPENNGDRS